MADEQATDGIFSPGWLRRDLARAADRRREWQSQHRRLRLAAEFYHLDLAALLAEVADLRRRVQELEAKNG